MGLYRYLACITVVVLHKQTALITLIFASVAARVCLLVRVVAAFQHVGLVNVSGDVDILVTHDLREVVTLRPRCHVLCGPTSRGLEDQVFRAT